MEYVLKTNAVCKSYRHFKALNGLSMSVPKGSIYGFVGKNGAGKTTLIRIVCGLQEPSSGGYTLYGRSNTEKDIKKSRRRMGAVVETPALYPDMTAMDNLKQQSKIIGLPSYDGLDEILKLVGLENTEKKKVKNFSLGMRQRLGIGIALVGNPDFLVLDEPVNGLDPQGIIEIRDLILAIIISAFFTASTASFTTMICMVCSKRSVSAVLSILIVLALLILASTMYNALFEPEMTNEMQMTINGIEFTEPQPNPLYVGGVRRQIYEFLVQFLPTGQGILVACEEVTQPVMNIIYSALSVIIVNVFGVFAFRKKDIK